MPEFWGRREYIPLFVEVNPFSDALGSVVAPLHWGLKNGPRFSAC